MVLFLMTFLLIPAKGENVHLEMAFTSHDGLVVKAYFPKPVSAKLYLKVGEEELPFHYPYWYKKFKSKGISKEHIFKIPSNKLKKFLFPKYTYWIQVIGQNEKKRYISYPVPVRFTLVNDRLVQVPIKSYYIAGIYNGKVRIILELSKPSIAQLKIFNERGEEIIRLTSHNKVGTPSRRKVHDFIVPLKPGKYYYQLSLLYPMVSTPKISFQVPGDNFNFVAMGDSRKAKAPESLYNYNGVAVEPLRHLLNQAYLHNANAIFFNGDLITGYTGKWEDALEQFNTFKAQFYSIWRSVPLYPMPGNHDLSSPWKYTDKENIVVDPEPPHSAENYWQSLWYLPENAPTPPADHPPTREIIYSLDMGNSHFVVLNPYFKFIGYARWNPTLPPLHGKYWGRLSQFQLDWLERDLREALKRGKRNLFVFVHIPLVPASTVYAKRGLNSTPEGRKLAEILSRYGVTALIVSHEHLYSRILVDGEVIDTVRRPFWQVNTSRAGAPFRVPDTRLSYKDKIVKTSIRNHLVLFKVRDNKVYMQAIDEWGQVFDEARLR